MGVGGDRDTILLVDDEPGFALTLAKRLRIRGYRCHVVHDGASALAAVEGDDFRGMLLDLRLPDIGGAEVLRKARVQDPDLPVIVMTAHGTDRDEEECMDAGARAFLAKPVDIDEIIGLLEAFRGPAA